MKAWTETHAKDVMTTPVKTVHEASSLESALELLSGEGISGAPIVAGDGRVVGVLTVADIVSHLAGLERGLGKLGEFYTRSFLRWDRASESYSNLDEEDDVLRNSNVSEVMTPEVISVLPEATLRDAAQAMHERSIHRVMVIDGERRLQGIISTLDVLGALLKSS